MKFRAMAACAMLAISGFVWGADAPQFYLHNGDRVVFYGDSITEQRMYSAILETFVATRYPDLNVMFVNSGWGGDTVRGGGGGPVDTRLSRDLFPYQPTVVTIMLGMNDGGYHAETEENDKKFFSGYAYIVDTIRKTLPQTRIVALEPTPYDEVTRTPAFPVAADVNYNEVLRSYGKWIANYADQAQIKAIDLNTPLVKMLRQANTLDPETAKQIIPDHVHPSFGGHLVMAAEILKAWHARPVVSSVVLDVRAKPRVESAQFATVTQLTNTDGITWTELDASLPLPFQQWQDMWGGGAPVGLSIRSSDAAKSLNQQILRVHGLKPGTYSLRIDGTSIGAFNDDQFNAGINLALLKTPATEQAMRAYQLVVSREEIHFDRWRNIQVPLHDDHFSQTQPAIDSLDALDNAIAAKIRDAARPVPHQFQIVPIS
jgi:lysophospholipase L1-like esterase